LTRRTITCIDGAQVDKVAALQKKEANIPWGWILDDGGAEDEQQEDQEELKEHTMRRSTARRW
jgi:hypothetical protein